MVDPVSGEERTVAARKVRVVVAGVVAVSCGLVAIGVDATLPQVGGALAAGLLVGAAVAWYVVPTGPSPAERRSRRRGNPLADGSGDDGGREEADPGRSRSSRSSDADRRRRR